MDDGKVDLKRLDADTLVSGLTSALSQIEAAYPGIAGKYGWAKLEDVERFTNALQAAADASTPVGLH